MDRIRDCRQGSMTVEAAGLMGAVLLVIFAVLYGNFYIHNRVWLTAAAYEAAIIGSMEEIETDKGAYQAAYDRAKALGDTGFFGLENLSVHVSTGDFTKVVYSGDMSSLMGGFASRLSCEGSYRVIDPVSFIRKMNIAKEFAQIWGEE